MDGKRTGLILGLGALLCIALIGIITLANRTSKPTAPSPSPVAATESPQTKPTDQPAATETGPRNVLIQNFNFTPASLTIKKGTTVTWTNQDSVAHTVTPDTKSDGSPSSPSLSQGQSYSFKFDAVGTFNYHCEPHPNMHGTVVVTE